jgi:hypothetical protein
VPSSWKTVGALQEYSSCILYGWPSHLSLNHFKVSASICSVTQ